MPLDEWKATASIRRDLVERFGHLKWSQMTVAECDEAVRREADAGRQSASPLNPTATSVDPTATPVR